MTATSLLSRPLPPRPQGQPVVVELRPGVRTAILLPSGCRFSAAAPNSMETVVRTLAGAMNARDLRIFCWEGADDHGLPGVEVLPGGPDRFRVLLDRLRAFRPEVVEHHQQVKQAIRVSRAMPEAAHLLYRHNALKTPRHQLDAWRYRARYGRMDGFVFVSTAERDGFARAYPDLADRAWAAPNPIDATPWLAPPDRREPVIAFAARAMAEKGMAEVCAALPAVLDRHADWRAVLMLNDWEQHKRWAQPHVAALERYGERVIVLRSASLSEVRTQLKSASIALTPSLWAEPFGLTAIEAHAAGAALISSGRGGLREASGPYAVYLDEITPRTLADAIHRLIKAPMTRLALAQAAQRHVTQVHSPEGRAADLLRARQAVRSRGWVRRAQEKSPTRAPG
jgi:glycosyltransferase involved in cell wall biosynthesis